MADKNVSSVTSLPSTRTLTLRQSCTCELKPEWKTLNLLSEWRIAIPAHPSATAENNSCFDIDRNSHAIVCSNNSADGQQLNEPLLPSSETFLILTEAGRVSTRKGLALETETFGEKQEKQQTDVDENSNSSGIIEDTSCVSDDYSDDDSNNIRNLCTAAENKETASLIERSETMKTANGLVSGSTQGGNLAHDVMPIRPQRTKRPLSHSVSTSSSKSEEELVHANPKTMDTPADRKNHRIVETIARDRPAYSELAEQPENANSLVDHLSMKTDRCDQTISTKNSPIEANGELSTYSAEVEASKESPAAAIDDRSALPDDFRNLEGDIRKSHLTSEAENLTEHFDEEEQAHSIASDVIPSNAGNSENAKWHNGSDETDNELQSELVDSSLPSAFELSNDFEPLCIIVNDDDDHQEPTANTKIDSKSPHPNTHQATDDIVEETNPESEISPDFPESCRDRSDETTIVEQNEQGREVYASSNEFGDQIPLTPLSNAATAGYNNQTAEYGSAKNSSSPSVLSSLSSASSSACSPLANLASAASSCSFPSPNDNCSGFSGREAIYSSPQLGRPTVISIVYNDPKKDLYPSIPVKSFEEEYYAKMRAVEEEFEEERQLEIEENRRSQLSIKSDLSRIIAARSPVENKQVQLSETKCFTSSTHVSQQARQTKAEKTLQSSYSAKSVSHQANGQPKGGVSANGKANVSATNGSKLKDQDLREDQLNTEYVKLQHMFTAWQMQLKRNEAIVNNGSAVPEDSLLLFQQLQSEMLQQHFKVQRLCDALQEEEDERPSPTNIQTARQASVGNIQDERSLSSSPAAAGNITVHRAVIEVSTKNNGFARGEFIKGDNGPAANLPQQFSRNERQFSISLNEADGIDMSSVVRPSQLFGSRKAAKQPDDDGRARPLLADPYHQSDRENGLLEKLSNYRRIGKSPQRYIANQRITKQQSQSSGLRRMNFLPENDDYAYQRDSVGEASHNHNGRSEAKQQQDERTIRLKQIRFAEDKNGARMLHENSNHIHKVANMDGRDIAYCAQRDQDCSLRNSASIGIVAKQYCNGMSTNSSYPREDFLNGSCHTSSPELRKSAHPRHINGGVMSANRMQAQQFLSESENCPQMIQNRRGHWPEVVSSHNGKTVVAKVANGNARPTPPNDECANVRGNNCNRSELLSSIRQFGGFNGLRKV